MRFNPENSIGEVVKQESERNSLEHLVNLSKEISYRQNSEIAEHYGIQDLLDSDCQIAINGYEEIYDETTLQEYNRELSKIENKFGSSSSDEQIDTWKNEKIKTKGYQTEMAITCLLYKMLGEKYIVARTNDYDDYTNGADNLLVDKETGAAICAFDEVYERDDQTANLEKKQKKVIDIALDGGTSIEFGLKHENGTLKRGKQDNLPVFYLELHKSELDSLLNNMGKEIDEVSDTEKQIFAKLVRSIAQQFITLKRQKLPQEVVDNMDKFRSSFAKLSIPK